MVVGHGIDFQRYLESVCSDYERWRRRYTLTDALSQQRTEREKNSSMFDFALMVERLQQSKLQQGEAPEKTERLIVLEGLRKYASEHVLLVGRPGSGKSTALVRLLLEEAQRLRSPFFRAAGGSEIRIPVLVELRQYKTSVLDLIRHFLERHGLQLDSSDIEILLSKGQFLLLVDGLNELPTEATPQDLKAFRQKYAATPMIFTTRDLGVGGNLEIDKQLEMQPLTEAQMQQFVHAYLPEQGDQMLRQLGRRLRELGQTPLLLSMLCTVFLEKKGDLPTNLGSLFRRFVELYDEEFKKDAPVSQESRRRWPEVLQHLAFEMIRGDNLTDLRVVIPRKKAEEILTTFLQGKVTQPEKWAHSCLNDLLNHHLIQLSSDNQIEFRHQLIQEYYAAESLLKKLSKISYDRLKWEYLNYLKWTEPLALMLGLVAEQYLALGVVKAALDVDLKLGARLAGATKPEFQAKAVKLIAELEINRQITFLYFIKFPRPIKINQLLKIYLFEITGSDEVINPLIEALKDEDYDVRISAVDALGELGSELAINPLSQALKDKFSEVRRRAAYALGKIGSESVINLLMQALKDEDYFVVWTAAYALCKILGKIRSELAINLLSQALKHKLSEVRSRAAYTLGEIGSESAINPLSQALKDKDSDVRSSAADALGKIGNELAINPLIQALKDKDYNVRGIAAYSLDKIGSESAINPLIQAFKHKNHSVRSRAADALGKIGSASAINPLSQALKDKHYYVRSSAADALGIIGSELAINPLSQALKDEDSDVRSSAAYALGIIGSESAINPLSQALKDKHYYVRSRAADALGVIGSELAINQLSQALKDKHYYVRSRAAYALGIIGSESAINPLSQALKDKHYYVRHHAAEALGVIGSELAINQLSQALKNKDYYVRHHAADALGKIHNELAINPLSQALKNKDYYVRRRAVYALGKIGNKSAINPLSQALKDKDSDVRSSAADALGKIGNCELLPRLYELLWNPEVKTNFRNLVNAMSAIQERCKYYNDSIVESPPPEEETLPVKESITINQNFSGASIGAANFDSTVQGDQIGTQHNR